MSRRLGPGGPALLALAVLALLGACAEDRTPDPVDRDPPPPPPQYDLSSDEGAGAALATLLAFADTAAIDVVLRDDATLVLEPGERTWYGWPVEALLARELRQGLRHLLGGEPVPVSPGGLQPAVDSLVVARWDLEVPFEDAPTGSPYPGTREGGYRVEFVAWADGDTLLAPLAGWLLTYVATDTVDGEVVHRIAGVRDFTGEDVADDLDGPTLGRLLIDYLANRPPEVALAVTPSSGPPGTRFVATVTGGADPEGGPLEFRWRFGDAEQLWTPWSADAAADTVFHTPATIAVTVAARDRWLLESAAFGTIVVLP